MHIAPSERRQPRPARRSRSSGRAAPVRTSRSVAGSRVGSRPVGFGGTPTKRRPSSVVLRRLGRRGRLEHQVAARLGLGERHDLADVGLAARAAPPSGRCRARCRRAAARRTRTRRGPPRTSRASPRRVWPCSRKLRSSRSRRWIRTEPPPSSQPLSARSYCIARARPAGSSGEGFAGSPDAVTSSASSSGTHAAERVVRGVPALVLGVPLVHREAVDPGVRRARSGSASPSRSPSSTRSRPRTSAVTSARVGDDQDEVAFGRAACAR